MSSAEKTPGSPKPEAIHVIELPLPPVVSSDETGACTTEVNPHGTGCIGRTDSRFQSGDFTPDGNHVAVTVEFVGALVGNIFTGEQVILIKTDGTVFPNGDPWKCLSCGVPSRNAQSINPEKDYPHVFRSGTKVLWGQNILDCGFLLSSEECTPNTTHIYPIYWPTSLSDSDSGGKPREMRLHPDDVHMGWSSFTTHGGQHAYFGRLLFNPNPISGRRAPRYDLVDVSVLLQPNGPAPIMETGNGNELEFHDEAITIGELRGFSGSGDEVLYIGFPRESNNIDIFAVHIVTGVVRRLTSHPEYVDPAAFSADNQWFVAMDTRGSDRQMWMSGMRMVPPLVDLVSITAAASTRNNGARRFFQPILLDRHGDRDGYYGQQINAGGDGRNGAVNDPNWNGRADPAWSYDSTKVVYSQSLVTSPACGGKNPLECPESTADGGRRYRVMLARLASRKPTRPAPVFQVPDFIPWAMSFPPGASMPKLHALPQGNYTIRGRCTGVAHASLVAGPTAGRFETISVNYSNFSDDGAHILNGVESVTCNVIPGEPWMNHLDWYSDLHQTGAVNASRITGRGGGFRCHFLFIRDRYVGFSLRSTL